MDSQANYKINSDIIKLQVKLKDIQLKLKNGKKSIKEDQIIELQNENEKLRKQHKFLENIIENTEHAYREQLVNLMGAIKHITEEYCTREEKKSYKQKIESIGISQDLIRDSFQ